MTDLELIKQRDISRELVMNITSIVNIEFDVKYECDIKVFCRLTFSSGEMTWFKDLRDLATYTSGMIRVQKLHEGVA